MLEEKTIMATFVISGTWTDQGIRNVKEAPKRIHGAHELAKNLGIDFKLYLTSGESDMLVIAETANPDNIIKFNLAIGAMGAVRTRTVRAWPEAEMARIISELP
jgi:uncharacterized protein with GYD domain